MTNRIGHSVILLYLVMVEEFLSQRVRDACGVRSFRTTTGRSWADPAPKHKRGIGERGRAYHINRVVERPRIFIRRSRAHNSINEFGELIYFDPGETPISHLFGAGHVTYSLAFAF